MTFETSGDQVDPGETWHCLDTGPQTEGGVFLITHFDTVKIPSHIENEIIRPFLLSVSF